jgi:hypothetical protein
MLKRWCWWRSGKGRLTSIREIEVPQTRALVRAAEALEADWLAALPLNFWAEVTVKLAKPEADLDSRVREESPF